MTPRIVALAILSLLLVACQDPTQPVVVNPASNAAPEVPPIYAVVYRCADGTVFTTFPNGANAQADFTARASQGQAPTSIAECEGTEAESAGEAEQLRNAVQPAPSVIQN